MFDKAKTKKRLAKERDLWKEKALKAEFDLQRMEHEAALCRAHLQFTRDELIKRGDEIPWPKSQVPVDAEHATEETEADLPEMDD